MYARPPPALIMWVWVCTPLYGGSGRNDGAEIEPTGHGGVSVALVQGQGLSSGPPRYVAKLGSARCQGPCRWGSAVVYLAHALPRLFTAQIMDQFPPLSGFHILPENAQGGESAPNWIGLAASFLQRDSIACGYRNGLAV